MRAPLLSLTLALGCAALPAAGAPAAWAQPDAGAKTAEERGEGEDRSDGAPGAPASEVFDPPDPTKQAAPMSTASAVPGRPVTGSGWSVTGSEGTVSAADLLASLGRCKPVSKGRFRADAGRRADVPVCGTRDVVFWKADLDIDCDGQRTRRCNPGTDLWFRPDTAFHQSDGRPLNAGKLPFVVVPARSRLWDHRAHGVGGGSVVAVVHKGRVRYGVVGDTGPWDIIGEASYAMAEGLGLPPGPRAGGAPSGVTYIAFRGSRVQPIESHREAVARGEELARRLVGDPHASDSGTAPDEDTWPD